MSKFKSGWQDRALLYVQDKLNTDNVSSKYKKTKLIFIWLCEYALSNDLWDNDKLALALSVGEMAEIMNASKAAITSSLKELSDCGAITRVDGKKSNPTTARPMGRPISITIINFTDD